MRPLVIKSEENLPSLIKQLGFGISKYVSFGMLIVGLINSGLYLAWSIHKRTALRNNVRDAIAYTIQEPIRNHDWITIKRTLNAFSMANVGSKICVIMPENFTIDQQQCTSDTYVTYPIALSDDKFKVAVHLPIIDVMALAGAPFLIAAMLIALSISRYLRKFAQRAMSDLNQLTFGNILEPFHFIETKIASQKIAEGIKLENEKAKYKTQAAIGAIAAQTAHDIRSPLSALTMVVGTLKEIPEEKRLLIRNATQRINDIANDLLQKGKEDTHSDPATSSNITQATSIEFVPVIIDILVSEKRMQFREHSGLEIEVDLKDSFGSFAQINSNELKRVISNLVNNAVEAFQNHQGRITVGVRKITAAHNQKVEIFVKDNGRGIPQHILEKLGQMGVTHGKEGTQSGSGLGVYHAKKTVESFGGTFEIDSLEGKGTTIRIILPLAEPPTWFANKIELTAKKYLISLDDDISIHQIWSGRLSSLGFNNIEHLRFQSGETFKHYVNSNMNKLKESIFLVDYELLNQPLTGLNIIDELGIEKYSILVTSRYEESAIQERASRLRLPILPKALAGFVPFEIQQPKEVYDLCLIDDDTQMIHTVWSMVAESKGLKIKMFATPQAFFSAAVSIDRRTPIYVDVSLGNCIKGTDVALEIHNLGFADINLATGYNADSIETPPFIRRVVGKDFPL